MKNFAAALIILAYLQVALGVAFVLYENSPNKGHLDIWQRITLPVISLIWPVYVGATLASFDQKDG